MFHTQIGLDLPFTYPPLAAVVFAPFAWLSLPVASAAITLTTLVLLIVVDGDRADRPGRLAHTTVTAEPAWLRRCWLAAAIVAPAVICLEPIRSNFDFGQINVVLMTLVIADCVPRRTPWPRGLLLGVAIALKLTPAVFLLYFLLRRDARAAGGHRGVGRWPRPWSASCWPGATPGSTGPTPCATPTGSAPRR